MTIVVRAREPASLDEMIFHERDPSLSRPYCGPGDDDEPGFNNWCAESVPTATLAILAFFIPMGLFVIFSAIDGSAQKRLVTGAVILVEAIALTVLVTEALKRYSGRLRPDFFARCDYKGYRIASEEALRGNNTLMEAYLDDTVPGRLVRVIDTTCEGLASAVGSSPSGHASLIWCAFTTVSVWCAFVIPDMRGRWNDDHMRAVNPGPLELYIKRILLFLFSVGPTIGAAFVAFSRPRDNRHFHSDVAAGSLIGFGMVCATAFVNRGSLLLPPEERRRVHLATKSRSESDDVPVMGHQNEDLYSPAASPAGPGVGSDAPHLAHSFSGSIGSDYGQFSSSSAVAQVSNSLESSS